MKKGNKVSKKLMDLIIDNGLVGVCVMLDPQDPNAEAVITSNMGPDQVKGLFKALSESPMKEQGSFKDGKKPLLIIKKNEYPS